MRVLLRSFLLALFMTSFVAGCGDDSMKKPPPVDPNAPPPKVSENKILGPTPKKQAQAPEQP